MKNNKGFTLIELLAVIVILLGLSLATAWGITSILEGRDKKEKKEQEELAKGAAKIYFSLQDDSNTTDDSDTECVNISELKERGYFTNTNKR